MTSIRAARERDQRSITEQSIPASSARQAFFRIPAVSRTYFIYRHACDGGDVGCSSRRRARRNRSIVRGSPTKKCTQIAPSLRVAGPGGELRSIAPHEGSFAAHDPAAVAREAVAHAQCPHASLADDPESAGNRCDRSRFRSRGVDLTIRRDHTMPPSRLLRWSGHLTATCCTRSQPSINRARSAANESFAR